MTLTARVSTFFLGTLAGALAVYSLVFYSVTSRQVYFQFDHEMVGVLNSLVAAAEVEETEVKWQPLEHSIAFGSLDEFGEVQWVVVGNRKQIVEASRTADSAFRNESIALANTQIASGTIRDSVLKSEPAILIYQRLSAPRPDARDRELDEFDEVTVVVGRSTVKRDAILRRLRFMVILLPFVAWLIAAILGRWVVRQALRPVSAMSRQARSIAGSDFRSRLKVTQSGDELAELGTTFNRLLDRQQIAFEQQRRFAGDAAHELRSPITVLLGEIDVTLRRPRTQFEYQSTLGVLRKQSKTLQEIVESLLFLARSEDDAALPELQSIELYSWVEEYRRTWSHPVRGNDFKIINRVAPGTAVRCTPALLTQIVENLVSNALKYSEPGTVVIIESESREKSAMIHVIDEGYGISDADQEHLFDAFFRSHSARKKGIVGNGLGLAIADRIATALGGSLRCESELGKGSRFTLRLPLAKIRQNDLPRKSND